MTTLNYREKAFEDKYAHDAEMLFKAQARRNRLFGEWLATEHLGITGEDDVKDYAASVVKADLEEEGDADVIRKVRADLDAKGVELSDHQIEKRLAEFLAEAKAQLLG